MTKKELEQLKKYFKEIYPHIWEHYKFLYERRINDTHRRFEFLLLMNTLLIIVFLQFLQELLNYSSLFYITLFFLVFPIIFYFIYIFPPKLFVPWFEKKDIKDTWEIKKDKDFSEQGLRSIYGVAPSLWIYVIKRGLFYRLSINFLLLSIFSILVIFTLINFPIFSILVSLISFFIILFVNIYLTKPIKNPTKKVEKFFDDWKKEIENSK